MPTLGTFTKDGRTRTAYTAQEAVRLRFDGWTLQADNGASSPPPQSGKGSGREAWAGYADSLGVEVTDDMNRDDIIAALHVAGADTEQ